MKTINPNEYRHIVFFTGAGMSMIFAPSAEKNSG